MRAASDLLRLLPYLMPYRARWIAMIVVAMVSLVATVAIPLMTKAVIDGPVRHQRSARAVGAGLGRDRGRASPRRCCGSSGAGWWPRATMGVEADIRKDLYARLQILPMSFHGRGSPASCCRES